MLIFDSFENIEIAYFVSTYMLPREYPKYRRGESGYNSLRQPWLIQIFKDIESIALNFVYYWTNE